MFQHPAFLALLSLLLPLCWRLCFPKKRDGVAYSSTSGLEAVPRTLRQRLMWLPGALSLLTLAVLIVAIARPREGRRRTISTSEGIAMQMVIDRSGSMQAMDFRIDGQRVDRLTAIKNVAEQFVLGGDDLDGRPTDLIGLISFAGYADAITPPTLDHRFLASQLAKTAIVQVRREDGTAIGDAIALAVEKLDALNTNDMSDQPQSKVVILLTDGENTAGEIEPLQAAEVAKSLGIKIYTIGVGTRGQAPFPVREPFSGRVVLQQMQVNIDETTLTRIAEITGGKYFRATDTSSLQAIYTEIDEMEKVEIESQAFVDYRELAVQPLGTRLGEVPPLLMLVVLLLMARILLQSLWLRPLL